jgi:hypothetical protein
MISEPCSWCSGTGFVDTVLCRTCKGLGKVDGADKDAFDYSAGYTAGFYAAERPEICICAAIRLPDGRVIRGHRHCHCIQTALDMVMWNGGVNPGTHHWSDDMGHDQGFVTSRNRYVGREQALQLQLAAGIKSACSSGYRARELFSEDLY